MKHTTDTRRDIIGEQPKPLWVILASVALLLIVAGTLIPIFQARTTAYMFMPIWFKFVYGAGALLLLVSRIFTRYKGTYDRLRRLCRIELWCPVFFCVATFFLFYENETTRDWLAFTMAGGALQVYTSIMIPRTARKALEEAEKDRKK